MKKISSILFTCLLCFVNAAGDSAAGTVSLLRTMKYADISGIGTLLSWTNGCVNVSVDAYWHGSIPTNIITISGDAEGFFADSSNLNLPPEDTTGTTTNLGCKMVFFAVTNEWKRMLSASATPEVDPWSWEYMHSLTNLGPATMLSFAPSLCPPGVFVDNADSPTAVLLSNLVHRAFNSTDREGYYYVLRDGLNSEQVELKKYQVDLYRSMISLLSTENEIGLIRAFNDEQLSHSYRKFALAYLCSKYGWSETNSVPE